MNEPTRIEQNGRSIAVVLNDLKQELKDFLETRIQLLKSEIQEKMAMLKLAAPLAVVAIVFAGTAYLLLTLALVDLVSVAFLNNTYRWFLAFLIVGVVWLIVAAMAGYFALREMRARELAPQRTIQVLKGDKAWLQSEAKSQI